MKCPECGAWSEVKESREGEALTFRRRRLCANGHLFTTYEVHPQTKKAAQRDLLATARRIEARVKRWARDQQLIRSARSADDLAREHNLTAARVRQIRAAGLLAEVKRKNHGNSKP